jgi:hypothetical protein
MRTARAALVIVVTISSTPAAADAQTEPCRYRGASDALADRPSPLDSVTIRLGDASAKLCYGRPSARGRSVVGVRDPFGAPWRLGANEPTTLHLPFAASIGGVEVGPGSYSLYAIPERSTWTIVVNRNTNRWGIPISADVRTADVGSFSVPVSALNDHVETLEFSFEPTGNAGGELVYRWERTTFRIPIARRTPAPAP